MRTIPIDSRYTEWRCSLCEKRWSGADGQHVCWTGRALAFFVAVLTVGQIAWVVAALLGRG